MAARKGLGDVRQRVAARYEKDRQRVRHLTEPEKYSDALERRIIAILQELGIDYPFDFDKPPPDVDVFHRQATETLEPSGSTTGSPAVATDADTYTFEAPDGGFLVIDQLDIVMEDPIADAFTIQYIFDGHGTSSLNYQDNQADSEPGHWKFGRIILADGGRLSVTVTNPDANASGVYSLEATGWRL